MANALLVNTMNGSVVTAKMAGMESIAKIRSVVSTAMSASNKGVAAFPSAVGMRNCGPWNSGTTRMCRWANRTRGLSSGCASTSS